MTRVISRVCNGLGTVILLVTILISGGLLLAQLLGWQPMGILSGSMEPNYNVGGLVFINTNTAPEDIGVDDVVAFYIGEDTVVTHRVIAVDPAARTFTTQGDANNVADGPTPFENLIGRAGLHVPLAGYALMNLKTTRGFAVGAILIAVLIVLFIVPVLLTPEQATRRARHARRANPPPLPGAETTGTGTGAAEAADTEAAGTNPDTAAPDTERYRRETRITRRKDND